MQQQIKHTGGKIIVQKYIISKKLDCLVWIEESIGEAQYCCMLEGGLIKSIDDHNIDHSIVYFQWKWSSCLLVGILIWQKWIVQPYFWCSLMLRSLECSVPWILWWKSSIFIVLVSDITMQLMIFANFGQDDIFVPETDNMSFLGWSKVLINSNGSSKNYGHVNHND